MKSSWCDGRRDVYDSPLAGLVLTYRRENGGVVQVAGKSGQHSSVVRVLLLVFHHHIERQLLVVGADQSGSGAARSEMSYVTSFCTLQKENASLEERERERERVQ